MKKAYIEPSIMVMNVKTSPLMTASDPLEVSGTTNQNLSRRGCSSWDEDDEDDY